MNPLEEYYEQLAEPHRSCLLAIRKLILQQSEYITESFSWNMPFFKYKRKMLCYLRNDKHSNKFYIAWSEGRNLEHHLLKAEGRKRFKVYYFVTNEDIDYQLIKAFVAQSIHSLES